MTENNKQDQQVDGAIEAIQTPAETDSPSSDTTTIAETKAQPLSYNAVFASVSLGISLIALATSGWLYYQSTQSTLPKEIAMLIEAQTNLDNKIDTNTVNKAQLNQLVEQISRSEHTLQKQTEQFSAAQIQQDDKLTTLETKLNRISHTTKEDWKLAEAEYLIRLANQRLLLESDNSGAVTLLSNADDILNALEDPIVFATRKALAKDIQALKSLSQFDLEGAYLKLNALYDNVKSLPQREPSKEWQANVAEKVTTENSTIDTATGKIASVLGSFWQSIRSLVVINYHHKPITALLPPAQYQQLVTGIQLQLDIAQVALIKGESVIYQQALSRVANATTEHFETQSNQVVSFLASLTTLQELNPAPELPMPRDSLVAMKELMKTWSQRGNDDVVTDSISSQVDMEDRTITPLEPGDKS
jgi:uroporphyrin-III C-methyltransferase